MFTRFPFVLAAILVAGTTFVSCDKKVDDTNVKANTKTAAVEVKDDTEAAVDATDTDTVDAADAVDAADTDTLDQAQGLAEAANKLAQDATDNVVVPPEATAAMEGLLYVLDAIADAGSQATCDKVLEELKKLDNDEIKTKLEGAKALENLDEDVIVSMQKTNSARMLGITVKMAGFQKCEEAPESAEIDATVKKLLSVVAPDEEVDAEEVDAEEVDAEEVDAEEVDAEEVDAEEAKPVVKVEEAKPVVKVEEAD